MIAFRSTHDAMKFEDACRKAEVPGRLIPLPREISAGCGLSWSAPPDEEKRMREILRRENISPEVLRVILV